MGISQDDKRALQEARHPDPFAVLGLQDCDGGGVEVRAWLKGVSSVECLPIETGGSFPMQKIDEGLFIAEFPDADAGFGYELAVTNDDGSTARVRDPYAFWSQIPEWDLDRFAEGRHHHISEIMGAHLDEVDGVEGVRFAVWAPNAKRVSVIGDWNDFDGRWHPMRHRHPYGVWEIFIPGIEVGQRYKYEVLGPNGSLEAKADPFARQSEVPPATASIVAPTSCHEWSDSPWLDRRLSEGWQGKPMGIYEVHLGSWRRDAEGKALGYRQLASELVEHVKALGFTHVEFLPLTAHPYEGSWGYQVSGYYAPDSRHGSADDLRYLIDCLHAEGIGVIMDVVPAHFPKDGFALGRFDGTPTFEYEDPKEGEHQEWGTYVFNFRRPEVRNFLIGSVLHWIREFHIDGIRVDAVSAMLYRDYNREEGGWVANEEGGNANFEAVSWLQELNATVHDLHAGVVTVAEESTAWKGTTAPTDWQGLGFDLKWNMGWMHDSLRYFAQDPVMRPGCHDWITFHQWYAYDERWVLPLSHDEVVHGKKSLIDKMPDGDMRTRLSHLRSLLGYQIAVPGRPLLFMGSEIAQGREWAWQGQIDWDEGLEAERSGLATFIGDCMALYKAEPALWLADDSRDGFRWVDCENRQESILAFLRQAEGHRPILVAVNFTPIDRPSYPLGVPARGKWALLLSSAHPKYWGDRDNDWDYPVYPTMEHEGLDGWSGVIRTDLPPLSINFYALKDD